MDYIEFENKLKIQAIEALPDYLSDENKETIISLMDEYSLMAGELLDKTEKPERDKELLQQFVAEWMFHKVIDLTKTKIPKEYWREILKKITLDILNIAPKVYDIDSCIDDVAVMVEKIVSETFEKEITELFNKEIITAEQMEEALELSNVDDMAQEELESKEESSEKIDPSSIFLFFGYLGIAISIYLHIKGIAEAAFLITCPITLVSLSFHNKKRLK